MNVDEIIANVRVSGARGESARQELANLEPIQKAQLIDVERREAVRSTNYAKLARMLTLIGCLCCSAVFLFPFALIKLSGVFFTFSATCLLIYSYLCSRTILPSRRHLNAMLSLSFVRDEQAISGLVRLLSIRTLARKWNIGTGAPGDVLLNRILDDRQNGPIQLDENAILVALTILRYGYFFDMPPFELPLSVACSLIENVLPASHSRVRRLLQKFAAEPPRNTKQMSMRNSAVRALGISSDEASNGSAETTDIASSTQKQRTKLLVGIISCGLLSLLIDIIVVGLFLLPYVAPGTNVPPQLSKLYWTLGAYAVPVLIAVIFFLAGSRSRFHVGLLLTSIVCVSLLITGYLGLLYSVLPTAAPALLNVNFVGSTVLTTALNALTISAVAQRTGLALEWRRWMKFGRET